MPFTCHTHHIGQRWFALRARQIINRRCAIRDSIGDLPGRGIAHAGARNAVWNADFNDASARYTQRAVIHIALAANGDEFIRHAACFGQAVHRAWIKPRHAGRRAKQHRGGSAGSDNARFGAGSLADLSAGGGLQMMHFHRGARGFRHRSQHFGRHQPAGKPRIRAIGIDDARHTKVIINHAGCSERVRRSALRQSA